MSQILLPFRHVFTWMARKKLSKKKEEKRAVQLLLWEPHQLGLPAVPLPAPLIVVECICIGKSKLKIRPACPGYDSSLYCSFPRALRQEGARYLVAALIKREPPEARPYYRTAGEIRRMEDSHV
jgi:hypothetical protein